MVAAAVSIFAQTPNFSGTWKLDRDASEITIEAGLANLGGGGTPGTLHVTHAANGTVTISSEVNESQARAYRLSGESSIPVGESSNITVTSRWDGGLLVTEGTQEPGYGRADISGVRRILGLSADHQTLTVKATTMTQHGENTSTFVYRKMQISEPCQNWSTPCN